MGLLKVPKKYNPPGKHTPMEYPAFINKAEMGLLKAHGAAGKMTRHGIRSFYFGDKGNAVGSAGASNYAGNGAGGQVNLSDVGGKTGNVLRNIGGEWTVVSKAHGAQIDAGKSVAPIRTKPAPVAAPVTRTVTTPAFMGPNVGMINTMPQIGGTNPAAMKAAIARATPGFAGPASSMSMANPGPQIGGTLSRASVGMDRGNVMSTTNQTPALGTNPRAGIGMDSGNVMARTNPRASMGMDSGNVMARTRSPAEIRQDEINRTKNTGVMGYGYVPARPYDKYNPADYQRPATSGTATPWGGTPQQPSGVPNTGFSGPQFGNTPLKTQTFPTPADNAEIAALNDYLNRPRAGFSSSQFGNAPTTPGYGVPTSFPGDKLFTDRVAQDPNMAGQITANGIPGYSTAYKNYRPASIPGPEARMLNSYGVSTADALQNALVEHAAVLAGRPPASVPASVPAGLGPTYGPETPAGAEDWQQGTVDPTAAPPEDQYGLDDFAGDVYDNIPAVKAYKTAKKAVKGIMGVLDKMSGNEQSPRNGGYTPSGPGGDGINRDRPRATDHHNPVTPPVPPPGTPGGPTAPVNPLAQWFYPQYQSTWAGLPAGFGGTYGPA